MMTDAVKLNSEIERLRPHYQSQSACNQARRQMLDHFDAFLSTARAEPAPSPDVVKIEPVGFRWRNKWVGTSKKWNFSDRNFDLDHMEIEPLYGPDAMGRIKELEAAEARSICAINKLPRVVIETHGTNGDVFVSLRKVRAAIRLSRRALTGEQKDFPQPQRKYGEEPCGECRLMPGDICDICGAKQTAGGTEEGWLMQPKGFGLKRVDMSCRVHML